MRYTSAHDTVISEEAAGVHPATDVSIFTRADKNFAAAAESRYMCSRETERVMVSALLK